MRRLRSVKGFLSRVFPLRLVLPMATLLLLWGTAAAAPAPPAEKIAVAPTAPYYLYIAYESLIVFWVAIVGLLVIIRMKLKEIERVQEMGVEEEPDNVPLLK